MNVYVYMHPYIINNKSHQYNKYLYNVRLRDWFGISNRDKWNEWRWWTSHGSPASNTDSMHGFVWMSWMSLMSWMLFPNVYIDAVYWGVVYQNCHLAADQLVVAQELHWMNNSLMALIEWLLDCLIAWLIVCLIDCINFNDINTITSKLDKTHFNWLTDDRSMKFHWRYLYGNSYAFINCMVIKMAAQCTEFYVKARKSMQFSHDW